MNLTDQITAAHGPELPPMPKGARTVEEILAKYQLGQQFVVELKGVIDRAVRLDRIETEQVLLKALRDR